jgi:hypothetical protein
MAYKVNGTQVAIDGNPYLWGSADTTTLPSNEIEILASDGAGGEYFGSSVAIGNGKIVITARYDNDNGTDSGSVYIYDLDGTNETKITPSDGAAGDRFGSSVAVGCGKIVVGADLDDDNGEDSGSVYIYDLDGTNETKITASDGSLSDQFGYVVAVGCGKIVVGARDSGSAYIYDLDGTNETKITIVGGVSDWFGRAVAVGCGRIVVGAPFSSSASGTVYIYDLNGNELAKITASDSAAGDLFGSTVAVGCGKIVVGARSNDDNGSSSGSAYIYDLDGTNETKITASDAGGGDEFGYSVAVGCGRIVVGATSDDDNGFNSGSVYIFDLNGNELAKITASDAGSDSFGYVVAVSHGKIVVGVNPGTNLGVAYIYDTPLVYTVWDAIDLQYG